MEDESKNSWARFDYDIFSVVKLFNYFGKGSVIWLEILK